MGDANTNLRLQPRITVMYRPDEALGILVPGQMDEVFANVRNPREERVEGTAIYSNYRRIDTDRAPPRPPS